VTGDPYESSPDAPTRQVHHRYVDPLDQIWLATARRIGLHIERAGDVYAATDGRGTLRIGTHATLDPDDCLAQMIFHELCHALVEGPASFVQPDWGLDNTGPRDVAREHACLRTQATLAGRHGLRALLAPTTDFRAYYDRLSEDPLTPGAMPADDASIALAEAALRRAELPPWAPHLETALRATAVIARAVAPFATAADEPGAGALPSLWRPVETRP
jgi:hypothetical protein